MSSFNNGFPKSSGSGACASLPNLGFGGSYKQCLSPGLSKLYFLNCVGMYVGISTMDQPFL